MKSQDVSGCGVVSLEQEGFGALTFPAYRVVPVLSPGTETEPAPTPVLPPKTDPPASPPAPQRQPAPPGPAPSPDPDPGHQPEVIPGPCRF